MSHKRKDDDKHERRSRNATTLCVPVPDKSYGKVSAQVTFEIVEIEGSRVFVKPTARDRNPLPGIWLEAGETLTLDISLDIEASPA